MPITDKEGNKLPQDRINKKVFARNVRERRMMQGQGINPTYCDMCGFRVRSVNHESGEHHQRAPKVIEAKRKEALGL